MQLPPFLARLIGDRSAVVPDLANAQDLGSIGGRFPSGLTTNINPRNPYRGAAASRDFPAIKLGWHPGTPPILRPDMMPKLPRVGVPPNETIKPITIASVPRIIPGSRP